MSFQSAIGQPVSQAISVAALLYTQTGRFKAQQAEKELKYHVQREEKKAQKLQEAAENREESYVEHMVHPTPREEMSGGQKAIQDFYVQSQINLAKKRLQLDPTNEKALADLEEFTNTADEAESADIRRQNELRAYREKQKKDTEKKEAASAAFAEKVTAPETPADRARKAVIDEQMRIRGGKEYNVSI